MSHVFFTNGGADAIENAVRMARIHTKRHKVLSFYRSYHGNTGTAIQMTGDPRRWPNEECFSFIFSKAGPIIFLPISRAFSTIFSSFIASKVATIEAVAKGSNSGYIPVGGVIIDKPNSCWAFMTATQSFLSKIILFV